MGLPYSSDGKESDCKAGDPGSIPGLGRFPGEGNHNPLQYACLEKPMDRGAWWAAEDHNADRRAPRLPLCSLCHCVLGSEVLEKDNVQSPSLQAHTLVRDRFINTDKIK